jgi:ABC-type ATPase with predicted acetyltransferase domain
MEKRIDFDKEKWEGGQYETDRVKIDPTTADGRPIILRRFQAKFKPDMDKFPSEKQLAEDHMKAVENFLWKDELVLIEKLRVIINQENKSYEVWATCQPRKGANLHHKIKTLEEVMKPGAGK